MTADLDAPPAKRQCSGLVHRHKLKWNLESSGPLFWLCQDEEITQSLLTRSISLALEAVGFVAADPVAIESFRAEVEEYMAHFLTDVRQSMLSSRRTLAIPQDFLQALHTHQLSLRSLLSHLDPPILPSRSQFALSTEVVEEEETYALPFLGPVLNGAPDERAKLYVPKHFPAFPSKHTYKATPDFPDRERDPRKIRERATEEGRMGEEALRRLVGAASENGPIPEPESSPKGWSMHRRRDHLWRETMQILIPRSENAPEGLEKEKQREGNVGEPLKGSSRVSSAVNADRRFWRKAIAPRALQRNPDHEGL